MSRHATGRSKKVREREKRRVRRRRDRAEQAQALGRLLDDVGNDTALLRDPGVPVEDAAAAFARLFAWHPPPRAIGEALVESIGPERAEAIVEVALRAEPSAAALALAADVALAVGDADAAEAHVMRARELSDDPDPDLGLRLAIAREAQHRIVDALRELRDALAGDPGLQGGQLLRGDLLRRVVAWDVHPPGDCPCGSGQPYGACCRDAAACLLAEFRDREPLYALRRAVEVFIDERPELRRHVGDSLRDWDEADALDLAGAGKEGQGLAGIALDRALTAPIDDDEGTILTELSADAGIPSEQADRAAEWGYWARWGLWQVDDLAEPGVLLTDYLTGARLYVHLAPEQRDGLRRWAVLVGCFSSMDGIWRSGSAFVQMSPAEARFLARLALRFVERIGRETGARSRSLVAWARQVEQELEEGRWLPDRAPRATKGIAETTRNVVSVVLPQLVAEARRLQRRPPQITNTDGDPLELIEARVELNDSGTAWRALLAHADFAADEDRITWYGDEMPEATRRELLERVRAEGQDPTDVPDGPQRWVRGFIQVEGNDLRIQVNSRGRLERLRALLADLGHPARVAEERVSDVGEELARSGRETPDRFVPPAAGPWVSVPLDEPIPLMDGLTLNEAAVREEYVDRLEVFLRELEHRGGPGDDLRQELGLLTV
jgi:hypothetical protein